MTTWSPVQALGIAEQVIPGKEVPHLQLQAQLLYRLGRHNEALKLYEQLYHTHKVKLVLTLYNVYAFQIAKHKAGQTWGSNSRQVLYQPQAHS